MWPAMRKGVSYQFVMSFSRSFQVVMFFFIWRFNISSVPRLSQWITPLLNWKGQVTLSSTLLTWNVSKALLTKYAQAYLASFLRHCLSVTGIIVDFFPYPKTDVEVHTASFVTELWNINQSPGAGISLFRSIKLSWQHKGINLPMYHFWVIYRHVCLVHFFNKQKN